MPTSLEIIVNKCDTAGCPAKKAYRVRNSEGLVAGDYCRPCAVKVAAEVSKKEQETKA